MIIRTASLHDAPQLLGIYAPYVKNTAITFEYDVPDEKEFAGRIENTLKEYPYLVAEEENGRIIGYAYAGMFRHRAAYKHSVEMSIYLDGEYRGQGIGRQLYQKLEQLLLQQNIYVLYACITTTEREQDAHLTPDSIFFHRKMGYTLAGTHHHCGYKFGKWYSMIWMEKSICERPEHPQPFIPFPEASLNGTDVYSH